MADNNTFLDDQDVVSFDVNQSETEVFKINPTMKIEEIKEIIQTWVNDNFNSNRKSINLFPYFFEYCKVLKQDGKGWKEGKIIIRFEFIPDEPDPEEETETQTKSLDEFRK